MLLTGESLLAFSFATNLFNKLVLVGSMQIYKILDADWSVQAIQQTEVREEEVRISQNQNRFLLNPIPCDVNF